MTLSLTTTQKGHKQGEQFHNVAVTAAATPTQSHQLTGVQWRLAATVLIRALDCKYIDLLDAMKLKMEWSAVLRAELHVEM